MIEPGIKKLIEENAVGFSTVDEEGKPHSIAVAYARVVRDKLIVTNTHIRESIKNLERNKSVSLVVWNKEWEKACVGYELKGEAKNFTSGEWFEMAKNMPENKGFDVKSAIVISVSKIKKLES